MDQSDRQMSQPHLHMEQQANETTFTKEELAKYNGSRKAPAYVAVNGIVYDMSNVIQWGGGTHFGLYSGNDLTQEFTGCHRVNADILQKLPVVGRLRQE